MTHNPSVYRLLPLEVRYPKSFDGMNLLLLPVSPQSIDLEPVRHYAVKNGFTAKHEYHLTVVGDRSVVDRLGAWLTMMPAEKRPGAKNALNELIPLLGPAWLKEGQYYHIAKSYNRGGIPEARESIIQLAEIEGIDTFQAAFSRLTGIELGRPFPHVTLFTKGTVENGARGIGVPSVEAFEAMQHRLITV